MMCGLLKPDRGQVFIHGRRIDGGSADLRARVGVCPQNVVLWGMLTCIEQLTFIGEMYGLPRLVARQRGESLLVAMGLNDKRDKLARTLSGGMQRRLNLIMALVHDPDILILDEPEAGLDPQSRVLVREYIRSLARHKTVILTTHNMDEADRVAILDRGQVLALDTPQALKQRVGEGDVLEIEVSGEVDIQCGATVAAGSVADVSTIGRALVVRGPGAVTQLPALLDALRNAGIQAGEVRLRANTLEDVFIALTGRRLRE
jgi:ABC-2 type transport system ATP-binding protein